MRALRLIILALLVGNLHVWAAPPPNDNFAAATVMTGNFWLTAGTLFGATSEPNEPILTGYPNGPTAWWRWQAPKSGRIRVRTYGSEQHNMVGVYRGATLDTTRLLAYGSSHFDRANSAEAGLEVTAGEIYSIQVLGADFASASFIESAFLPSRIQLSLIYAFSETPPPNDKFANATVLTGATADLVVNLSGADHEPGEPVDEPDAQGNSVWLSWTAPGTGVWQVDARQGDFDSIITIFTGSTLATLTRLDFADVDSTADGNPYFGGGRVTFGATAGQTYHFRVQGASLPGSDYEYGNARLQLQPVKPPVNDDFASATVLQGASPSAEGWTTFAHREVGEPVSKVDESRTIWWKWTAPSSGLLAVIEYEGMVDTYVGTSLANLTTPTRAPNPVTRGSLGGVTDWFSVTAGTTLWLRGSGYSDRVTLSLRLVQAPPNDDFADRKLLVGAVADDDVDLEYASWEQEEPGTDSFGPKSAWYRWVAPSTGRFIISTKGSPYFTRVKVFTGSTLTALTPAGDEELLGFSPAAYGRVVLEAVAGTEYQIELQRQSFVTGLDHISIRQPHPPSNDNFASATVMTGNSWSATGSNADATSEDGDFGGSNVWWKWTAPAGGLYRVSTAGSAVDTVLAVYTGTALNALTPVAQDESSAWGATGATLFQATAGTTYYFAVAGQEGVLRIALNAVGAPPNDLFANRLTLAGMTTAGGTVLGASSEPGEPVVAAQGGHSVWYTWTAASSGTAFFKVVASHFDPAFGLFQGSTLASLQANITGGSGAASANAQTFLSGYPVSKGTTYVIRVDGSPADNGDFSISVEMPSPPVNDNFASRAILSGALIHTSGNNLGATAQTGEPAHAGNSARFSIWWEWTAPENGPVTMDTQGSASQARLAVYTGTVVTALTPIANGPVLFPATYASLSFNATAGARYVIAADSGDRSRGNIQLNIASSAATPPNDAFAAAIPLPGDSFEIFARPVGATAEPGEPQPGGRPAAHSLWWKWTPQTTRAAMFWIETENQNLLARFAVYKGGTLHSLTPVGALSADVHWSRLGVDVFAGDTYYIAIDTPSTSVDPGFIKMGVVPLNGTFANAVPISAADGTVTTDTHSASNEDPSIAPTSLRQLWWYWVAEQNGRMEWRISAATPDGVDLSVSSPSAFFAQTANATFGRVVPGSGDVTGTFDAVAGGTYFLKVITHEPERVSVRLLEAPEPVPPSNDQRYRAQPMTGNSWSSSFTLGNESGDQLYWTWTAPTSGVAQIQLTGALADDDALLAYADGILDMAAGASHSNGGPPVLRISSVAGQQWTFVTRSDLRRPRAAVLSLVSPAPGTPPANDAWDSPTVLLPSWSSVAGDVTFASCQPGEPDHSSSGGTRVATKFPPGRSVWYEYTPPTNGVVEFRLDSPVALAMQFYRGRTPEEWQVETFLQPGARVLPVFLIAGQTYHIAIATRPYEEQTAAFVLRRGSAAPNDMLSDAIVLNGSAASSSVDSFGATVESGEPGNGFNFETLRGTLWWKWTAPSTGLVWMDTLGSTFDTILAVYASDPPDETARVAENHHATAQPGVNTSAVVFPAVGGQAYLIRIAHGDTNEPAGMAQLNLTVSSPPDPYTQWTRNHPQLTGAAAQDTADPDGDGIPNLAELVFGGNPLKADAPSRGPLRITEVEGGFAVEATVDRNSLEALHGGDSIKLEWQVSRDLRTWQPGPAPRFVRNDGSFSVEQIILGPDDPPFARLVIRRQ